MGCSVRADGDKARSGGTSISPGGPWRMCTRESGEPGRDGTLVSARESRTCEFAIVRRWLPTRCKRPGDAINGVHESENVFARLSLNTCERPERSTNESVPPNVALSDRRDSLWGRYAVTAFFRRFIAEN